MRSARPSERPPTGRSRPTRGLRGPSGCRRGLRGELMDDLHARFHVVILTTAEDKRLSPRYLEERFAGVGLFVCRSDLGDEALEIDKIADDSPPSFGSHMLEVDLHRRALGERAADPHDTCTHGFELLYIPAGGTRLRGLNVARRRFALRTLSASATATALDDSRV